MTFVVFNTFSSRYISFVLVNISLYTVAIVSGLIIFTNGEFVTMMPSSVTFVDIVTCKGSHVGGCFVSIITNAFVRGFGKDFSFVSFCTIVIQWELIRVHREHY